MKRWNNHIERMMRDADRRFQPVVQSDPAVPRICVEHLIQETSRRRRRLRVASTACAVAVALIFFATTWQKSNIDHHAPQTAINTGGGPPPQRSRLALDMKSSANALLGQLDHECALISHVTKTMRNQRQYAEMRRELAKRRRAHDVVNIQAPLEQLACLRLSLALELERMGNAKEFAMNEYREIITQFPQTHSATLAKDRLAATGKS